MVLTFLFKNPYLAFVGVGIGRDFSIDRLLKKSIMQYSTLTQSSLLLMRRG